jgi:hypothetical protein
VGEDQAAFISSMTAFANALGVSGDGL